MNRNPPIVLGLFPEFSTNYLGGIQESARAAWEAISQTVGTELVCYSSDLHSVKGDDSKRLSNSRLGAILSTRRQQNVADLVFVWHLGLIKLLPFLPYKPKRIAVFLHGIEAWKQPDWLTHRLSKRVDLFLSNSDYTWQRFLSLNPHLKESRHITVPLGIGRPHIPAITVSGETPFALMISRLSTAEDYKGHREILNAWPLVLKRNPSLRLCIAGDGDLRHHLVQLTQELGIASSVKFLGKVNELEKCELLEQSRCLFMPSRGEGFGLVYLEAMRVGKPCLVSTLDAGREVVNPPETGLSADPNNEEALANAMLRLLGDGPEWQQWSSQAKRRYEENYTVQHFQERLMRALFGTEGQSVSEVTRQEVPINV